VLFKQFGLHVGIFDNKSREVKLQAAMGWQTQQRPAYLIQMAAWEHTRDAAPACLNFRSGRKAEEKMD
jgi:hypothetical protein